MSFVGGKLPVHYPGGSEILVDVEVGFHLMTVKCSETTFGKFALIEGGLKRITIENLN